MTEGNSAQCTCNTSCTQCKNIRNTNAVLGNKINRIAKAIETINSIRSSLAGDPFAAGYYYGIVLEKIIEIITESESFND